MPTATVLCPDLGNNCLGRAHVLARLLQPRHEVTIAGPAAGPVWEPLRADPGVPLAPFPVGAGSGASGREAWRALVKAGHLDADLVVVSKPFALSLWAARQRRGGAGLLLDIDDWEVGILRQYHSTLPLGRRLRRYGRMGSGDYRVPWNVVGGDVAARFVEHRTVSNRWLQAKYGGPVVWHARDSSEFDPSHYPAERSRDRFGIAPGRKAVLFLGTPRRQKGIEDLVAAVAALPDRSAFLWVVGVDGSPYGEELRRLAQARLGDRVRLDPPIPFADAPDALAAADVVVIPQRDVAAARGQMPAKVFDAMAMARPLVVTDVSDLREAVGEGGLVVPPGDVAGLSAAIGRLLADPAEARRMGQRARARFLATASLAAVRPVLEAALPPPRA
jgi:glycosyltransferase involved in cell wall biosynthesis